MTDRPAPASPPSPLHRAYAWLQARPDVAAAGIYVAVATLAVIAAYFAVFSQFASYDDDGTLLVSLKGFVDGDALYADVYSPYGPFYYELFGSLFSITGWSVSNDASRQLLVLVWVGACLLYGLSVHELTGRLLLGATAMIVAFPVLSVFVNEPMHPQALCALLLAGLTLLLAGGPPRRLLLGGAGAGALIGALVLTKVNLGGLAIAAIALAAVLTVEPLYRRRWLRWPVIAAFVLLPTALMARELRADWVRELIALELLATVALLVAARTLRPRRGEGDGGLSSWILGACLGFAAAFAAILAGMLATGSTLGDLYDGAIVQGFKIGDVFIIPLTSPSAAVDWAVAAVAAAVLVVQFRGDGSGPPSIWPGLLRTAAGLVIWLTIARAAPFSLGPASNQLALPLVLAWIAAVPPAGLAEPPYRRFLRVALPALALTEALGVYPVAGSQTGIAAVAFVAVGGLCLADGLRELQAWSAARGQRTLERFGMLTAVALVALGGKLALSGMLRPAISNAIAYGDQPALPFDGAELVHPPAGQVAEYSALADLLQGHRCTTFIGYPNLNSLYLWTGIDPPRPSAPGAWAIVLDSEHQQRVVEEMRASPRPCVLRNEGAAGFWLQGKSRPDTPLVRYIFDGFRPAGQFAEWQFLVPKSGPGG